MRKFIWMSVAFVALIVQPTGANAAPPAALVEVGESSENIYDFAKAKDWAKIGGKWKTLAEAAKQLAGELKGADAGRQRLADVLKSLETAIAAKDEQATKRAANQVTLIAADLSEPFKPEIPAAVTRLDYYGRELEIGVAAKDLAMLKSTADAMRKEWTKLQPAVKTKGGNAEAKKFSDLMVQVAAARSVEDYARVTTPIMDEVDNLEKVFKKK